MFDIGIVYSKDGHLFLAVSSDLLLTVDSEGLLEVSPSTKSGFEERRKKSVRDLIESWGITSKLLDEIAEAYMQRERKTFEDNPEAKPDLATLFEAFSGFSLDDWTCD